MGSLCAGPSGWPGFFRRRDSQCHVQPGCLESVARARGAQACGLFVHGFGRRIYWRVVVDLASPLGREFPETVTTSQHNTDTRQREMTREPEEVRHLREFSNFLSPRIGFFQSEMWNAIIAVLSAVLPAVVVASAVMAFAFLVWLGFSSLILVDALNLPLPTLRGVRAGADWLNLPLPKLSWFKGWLAPLAISLVIIGPYFSFERRWRSLGKAEQTSSNSGEGKVHGLVLFVVACGHLRGLVFARPFRLFGCGSPVEPHPWEWATEYKAAAEGRLLF